jgi:hypothetical protein
MFFGPSAAQGGRRGPRMRILYDQDPVTVTNRYVRAGDLRVAIADLRSLTTREVPAYPLVKVAAATAGIELAVAVPLAVAHGSLPLLCAGALSGAGMALGALADSRRNPRLMFIHADVGDRRQITLLATADKREFGQVRRALIRAMEEHRDSMF